MKCFDKQPGLVRPAIAAPCLVRDTQTHEAKHDYERDAMHDCDSLDCYGFWLARAFANRGSSNGASTGISADCGDTGCGIKRKAELLVARGLSDPASEQP